MWLLSFDPSSPDITETMLADCGLKNVVREIHSMQWQDSKYVLLNLDRKGRVRIQQMKTTAEKLERKFGATGAQLVADDTHHPVLERMMEAMDDGGGAVKSWRADSGNQQTKIGFLRRAVHGGERGAESSGFKRLKALHSELSRKLESVMQENAELKDENRRLRENRVSLVSS